MPTTLLEQTKLLLKERPNYLALKTIAEDLSIPISWLSQFNRELIADPGVKRIQILHDYLSDKKKEQPELI